MIFSGVGLLLLLLLLLLGLLLLLWLLRGGRALARLLLVLVHGRRLVALALRCLLLLLPVLLLLVLLLLASEHLRAGGLALLARPAELAILVLLLQDRKELPKHRRAQVAVGDLHTHGSVQVAIAGALPQWRELTPPPLAPLSPPAPR